MGEISGVRIFLVTGGGRGIGEAVSLAAAREGRFVLLSWTQNAARAAALVEQIRSQGGRAAAFRADSEREEDLLALFAEADRLGKLDAMVYNSAVTGPSSPLADAATATLDEVIAVNLRGALIAAREAVRRLSTDHGGHGGTITFISSRATVYGSPGEHVWYAATKGGIDALTIGLAREVAAQGIRVNAVSPGLIATEMHRPGKLESVATVPPMRRPGTPQEVAAAVMFLASDAASYVTGANLAVSGGR
jgi:NAD(P)-dependent dehydrogenase (short-subunit alcohol dehydrogenase family)